MSKTKRKTRVADIDLGTMKTTWATVKDFSVETIQNENGESKGIWLMGKALNGKRLCKYISSVSLRAMLVNDKIYCVSTSQA